VTFRARSGFRWGDNNKHSVVNASVGFRFGVFRGGEARNTLTQRNGCRSAYRYGYRTVGASYSGGGIGFRLFCEGCKDGIKCKESKYGW